MKSIQRFQLSPLPVHPDESASRSPGPKDEAEPLKAQLWLTRKAKSLGLILEDREQPQGPMMVQILGIYRQNNLRPGTAS